MSLNISEISKYLYPEIVKIIESYVNDDMILTYDEFYNIIKIFKKDNNKEIPRNGFVNNTILNIYSVPDNVLLGILRRVGIHSTNSSISFDDIVKNVQEKDILYSDKFENYDNSIDNIYSYNNELFNSVCRIKSPGWIVHRDVQPHKLEFFTNELKQCQNDWYFIHYIGSTSNKYFIKFINS